ncbi:MAG: class I SAM-dependent methyltransferase [Acidobacteria bacterium]|nr:MAG: class I SAM-dependent methyltransferase [Acidobacteriota bacterium]
MRGLEQIPWLYDATMALMEPFGLGLWRRRLLATVRGRVLEVGCGTGRNLPSYRGRPVGIDLHLDLLLRARRRAPEALLVMASVEALPFRDRSFDTVVSSLVFCSVPQPRRGLAEIARVLAPGGTLRMLEHVRLRSRLGGRLQDLIQPLWTRLTGGCHPNRDTEATVRAAGFVVDPKSRRARGTMRLFSARPPAARAQGS